MPYKNLADKLANNRKWRLANPEKYRAAVRKCPSRSLEYQRTYRLAKPGVHRAAGRKWASRNKERALEIGRQHYIANKGKYFAKSAARRAARLNATPPWVDHAALVAIYERARALKLEVDHIVPLCHELVCGLHVP